MRLSDKLFMTIMYVLFLETKAFRYLYSKVPVYIKI